MASLITANGGGGFALLSGQHHGWATGIGLGFFAIGVTAALIAGRFASRQAYVQHALCTCLVDVERASRQILWAGATRDPKEFDAAEEYLKKAEERAAGANEVASRTPLPDLPLGLGIYAFVLGCVAAGFALF